jgi:hypothetical protein
MIRKFLLIVGVLAVIPLLAGCVDSPLVVQGEVRSYDSQTKILVVEDERNPGQYLSISLEKADMGAEPASGDLVRLAYRDQDGTLTATRVMNLSHQTELKKKG